MRSGVLETRSRTSPPGQTHRAEEAGCFLPTPRPTLQGAPPAPQISSPFPHPYCAEQNTGGDILTAQLPLPGDSPQPRSWQTPCSSHPRPGVSGVQAPPRTAQSPLINRLLLQTPHPVGTPPSAAWQRGLTPAHSPSPGSSLHSAASRPGFSRRLLDSRGAGLPASPQPSKPRPFLGHAVCELNASSLTG